MGKVKVYVENYRNLESISDMLDQVLSGNEEALIAHNSRISPYRNKDIWKQRHVLNSSKFDGKMNNFMADFAKMFDYIFESFKKLKKARGSEPHTLYVMYRSSVFKNQHTTHGALIHFSALVVSIPGGKFPSHEVNTVMYVPIRSGSSLACVDILKCETAENAVNYMKVSEVLNG